MRVPMSECEVDEAGHYTTIVDDVRREAWPIEEWNTVQARIEVACRAVAKLREHLPWCRHASKSSGWADGVVVPVESAQEFVTLLRELPTLVHELAVLRGERCPEGHDFPQGPNSAPDEDDPRWRVWVCPECGSEWGGHLADSDG